MARSASDPEVSLLLNWYSEDSFLSDMWVAVAPHVDEVVVVAGPYAFSVDALETFGLTLSHDEARARIEAVVGNVPLTFIEKVWASEAEKRIAGYAACNSDLVLIVDADEVVQIDSGRIREFFASDYAVGQIDVVNVASSTAVFGAEYFDYVDNFPRKTVLFRRDAVSALDHLNYLWLVGVEQDTEHLKPADPDSLGLMVHMTGPRSVVDHATRIVFYRSLYYANNAPDRMTELIDELDRFAGHRLAYLAASEDSQGVSRQFVYRPIPDALLNLGSLWSSLSTTAVAFERDRRAQTAMDSWPQGSYVPFAEPVPGAGGSWTLTLPARFTVLGYEGVLDDGRLGELHPTSAERFENSVDFTCVQTLTLFPPLVRVWG